MSWALCRDICLFCCSFGLGIHFFPAAVVDGVVWTEESLLCSTSIIELWDPLMCPSMKPPQTPALKSDHSLVASWARQNILLSILLFFPFPLFPSSSFLVFLSIFLPACVPTHLSSFLPSFYYIPIFLSVINFFYFIPFFFFCCKN